MTFKYFIKLEIPNRKLIRGPRAGLPINEDKIGEACKAVPIDLTLKKNIYIYLIVKIYLTMLLEILVKD